MRPRFGSRHPEVAHDLLDQPVDGQVQPEQSATPEQTATQVTLVPAVNLLPAAYAMRAAGHRARFFALCTVLLGFALCVLLWLMSWQEAVSAQERLDGVIAERTMLQTQAARYADVPKVLAEVTKAESEVSSALGNEVRWSFFLNDIALMMPDGVSLDTLNVTSLAPGAAPAAQDSVTGQGGLAVGQWTVTAKAMGYPKVAQWMDSMSRLKTLNSLAVSGMSVAEEQGVKVVPFSATATITPQALSQRYSAKEAGQ